MTTTTTNYNNFLLKTVTSTLPPIDHRRPKEDMDQLIRNELGKGNDTRVIWEESTQVKEKESILDVLIQWSNLTVEDLYQIRYLKKQGDGVSKIGAPILQKLSPANGGPRWRLNSAFPNGGKRVMSETSSKKEETDSSHGIVTDTDRDEEIMIETDGSLGSLYVRGGRRKPGKRLKPRTKSSEEKNWERLLRNISYAMRTMIIKEKDCPLPFHRNVLPKPRYWSSEFSATPIGNETDSRKPDLVLLDFRMRSSNAKSWSDVLTAIEVTSSELTPGSCPNVPVYLGVVTKGYLILREQPWRRFVLLFSIANSKLRAHYLDRSGMIISRPLPIHSKAVRFVDVLNTVTLSNLTSLGFDPTIHVCVGFCSGSHHDGPPECVSEMPPEAKGWIMDNDEEVYWIMAVIWRSHSLFSRGTVCFRVQDKKGDVYALKDCWVDAERIDYESDLLKTVSDIPNVVRLVKCWNVQYNGCVDETAWIRQAYGHLSDKPISNNRIHRRMLLTPCGLPLTMNFKDVPELVSAFYDLVIGEFLCIRQQGTS